MRTTIQFLDALKERNSLTSDYQLAKFLGVKHGTISSYRVGRTMMDEAMCLRVAELLELNPAHVLASIAAERAKDQKVKRAWESAAVATATVLMAAVALALDVDQLADLGVVVDEETFATTVYYVKCAALVSLALLLFATLRSSGPRPRPE